MAYFPNGTSGMIYEEEHCSKCQHYPRDMEDPPCSILHLHMLYNYDKEMRPLLDTLIPMEGCWAEKCTMFIRRTKTDKQIKDEQEQEYRENQYKLWKEKC